VIAAQCEPDLLDVAGQRRVIVAKQIHTAMPQSRLFLVWREVHVARSRWIVCWSRVRPRGPPSIRRLRPEWNTTGQVARSALRCSVRKREEADLNCSC